MKPLKHYVPSATDCLALAAALALVGGTSCTERSTAFSPEGAAASLKCCPEPVPSSTPRKAAGSMTMTDWLPEAQRVKQFPFDLRATNQDGDHLRLSSLIGQPLAISFVYTRCTNPSKCVRVMEKTAELQDALEKAGLGSATRLLIFTYDPEFDSPAVLKGYGETHGFRFGPNAMMLRVDLADKRALMERLDIAVNFNSEGVNIHGLQLLLVDSKGFLARVYHTVIWDTGQIVQELRRLAME